MRYRKKLLLMMLLLAVMGLSACKPAPSQSARVIEVWDAVAVNEDLGNYGFLSSVRAIRYEEPFLFVSDYDHGRVLRMRPDLSVDGQIGTLGPGPGELQAAGLIHLYQDLLFVFNEGTHKLLLFDEQGAFEEQVPFPGVLPHTRFFINGGMIYIPTPGFEQQPISSFNLQGDKQASFGEPFDSPHAAERRARSGRHLLPVVLDGKTMIVAVGETEPVFSLYDISGLLVHHTELPVHPSLMPRLDFRDEAHKQPENRSKSYILFADAEVRDQRLYALAVGQDEHSDVLVYAISPQGFREEKVIRIPTQIDAFTIGASDRLYAYSQSQGRVYVFAPR